MSLEEAVGAQAPTRVAVASTSEKDRDRRRAARKSAGVTAHISGPGIDAPLPCIVCETSATGARLYLHDSVDNTLGARARVPQRFTLTIRADRIEVDCACVWRKLGLLGVRFLAPARPLLRRVR